MKIVGYGVFIKGEMVAFFKNKNECFAVSGVVLPVYISLEV
jgi:hypothetical protein